MRAAHSPAPGDIIPSHYRWCFGCGAEQPAGLHMTVTAGEGLTVVGDLLVSEHHQGAPGLAHGGLLSAAVDEVLGSLNWLLDGPAVTGRLECDFRRPVPVGAQLRIHAEVVGVQGRKIFTRAIGRLDAGEGRIAISAAAMFVHVPLEHFLKYADPKYVQLAIDDRAAGGPAWRPEGDKDQRAYEVNP